LDLQIQFARPPREIDSEGILDMNSRVEVIVASFRLNLGSAAVDEQFDTRDETGVIRSEKQRHLSNFLGFPMRLIGIVDTIRAMTSADSREQLPLTRPLKEALGDCA
jgi:hypothetical protein